VMVPVPAMPSTMAVPFMAMAAILMMFMRVHAQKSKGLAYD
jgi:hypothetical protein